jgi:hypothetical protein
MDKQKQTGSELHLANEAEIFKNAVCAGCGTRDYKRLNLLWVTPLQMLLESGLDPTKLYRSVVVLCAACEAHRVRNLAFATMVESKALVFEAKELPIEIKELT